MTLTAEQVERYRAELKRLFNHHSGVNALCDAARAGLAQSAIAASDSALLPGLREALKWKPNTPQLENAMTYAWESAIKSFIRALEAAAPAPAQEPVAKFHVSRAADYAAPAARTEEGRADSSFAAKDDK